MKFPSHRIGSPAGVPVILRPSRALTPAEVALLHVIIETPPPMLTRLPDCLPDRLVGERFIFPLMNLANWRRCCRTLGIPGNENGFGKVLHMLRTIQSIEIEVLEASSPENPCAVRFIEKDRETILREGEWENASVVLRPLLIHFFHPIPRWLESSRPLPL
ncbi:MAG: hypothetical protein QM627_09070 [Luteolibacter sp.]